MSINTTVGMLKGSYLGFDVGIQGELHHVTTGPPLSAIRRRHLRGEAVQRQRAKQVAAHARLDLLRSLALDSFVAQLSSEARA